MNKIYKTTELFESLYIKGFKFLKLESKKGRDLQVDLEIYIDQIAGPMTHFYEKGNYEYVFKDKEDRFKGIKNQNDFKKWALNIVAQIFRYINNFNPKSNIELTDKNKLLEKANALNELILQAEKEYGSFQYNDDYVLTAYIFKNYNHFFTEHENKIVRSGFLNEKISNCTSQEYATFLLNKFGKDILIETEVFPESYDDFRNKVKNRILKEHKSEIIINRCKKCNKILETPNAKLCLWCGYSMYEEK